MSEHDNSNVAVCSFCGTKHKIGDRLLQGPRGVSICTNCAQNVLDMFSPKDLGRDLRTIAEQARKEDEAELAKERKGDFSGITPSKIKAELDKSIIGQDETKKVIAVAVYNHYKRLEANGKKRSKNCPTDLKGVKIDKSNIILAGPTGSGKTLFAKTIADFLGVPFAIADATTLTEAGYVGEDVENIVRYLWINSGRNKERTERGVVFIDELDKIASKTQNVSITRDVSGEGVQQALLKIVEGTICRFTPEGGRKHPEAPLIEIDTRNILFIAGGAFVGLDDIRDKRTQGKGTIGFGFTPSTDDEDTKNAKEILSEDLVKFGLIPELIGRFPIISELKELTEDQLLQVLTQPKNAIIKQYRKLLWQSGINLDFKEDAMKKVAQQAIERKTGARGLRAEIEKIMLDVMFDAPDKCSKGDTIEVAGDSISVVHIATGEREYLTAA